MKIVKLSIATLALAFLASCSHGMRSNAGDGHACCDKKEHVCKEGKCKKDKSCCDDACGSCDGEGSCADGNCDLKK